MEEERGSIQLMREAAEAIDVLLPLAFDAWEPESVVKYAALAGRLEATADTMEAARELINSVSKAMLELVDDEEPETANG